ncbi:MAG: zf-HC2 domain-containing protein [Clostridiaceae bacterium]|nr:zf-HC2 domain-containing protein [Clostridiaceae bacterium]
MINKQGSHMEKHFIDYLDGNLDESTCFSLELHLRQCSECRDKLELQRQWLEMRQKHLPPAGSLDVEDRERLSALDKQIRHHLKNGEAAGQSVPAARPAFWRRPVFWYESIGAICCVVLLILSLPLFQAHFASSTMQAGFLADQAANSMLNSTNERTSKAAVDQKTAVSAGGWQVFAGALTDIPAVACFYEENEPAADTAGDQASAIATSAGIEEIMTDAANGAEVSTGSQNEMAVVENITTRDFFAPGSKVLSPEGRAAFDLLEKADLLRVLVFSGTDDKVLILAAYPANLTRNYLERFHQALDTCQTPIKIEIIETSELPGLLNGLEEGLYGKTFTTAATSDVSWISLLIGA